MIKLDAYILAVYTVNDLEASFRTAYNHLAVRITNLDDVKRTSGAEEFRAGLTSLSIGGFAGFLVNLDLRTGNPV